VNSQHTDGQVIDRLFEALSAGDLDAARLCLTPDARVWHGFDCIAHGPDSICQDWKKFVTNFSERHIADVRRSATATGFVQQHLMIARTAGKQMAWPVCIVVVVRDGLIARLDEYIDRAGHFSPPEGVVTTPGQ
jgi:ketosteroid isomerase-like protein